MKNFDCYNVTSIGANAFENCTRLKSVILYEGVESIGENAFQGCSSLKEIYVAWAEGERDGAPWGADNAIIYYSSVGSVGLEYTLKSDNTYEICSAANSTDIDIVIPKYYNGLPVTSIDDSVFKNNASITSVIIPDGVTYIGTHAFYNCTSLTSVVIPNTILMLESDVFMNCSKLVYYEYDNGYYLGNENNPYVVFVKAKNKDITSCIIHENTKIIYNNAFSPVINNIQSGCKLTTINIPQGVIQIGNEAFELCGNLTSISIPNSVITIGHRAFDDCSKLVYNEYNNGCYLGNDDNPYLVFIQEKDDSVAVAFDILHNDTKIIYSNAFYYNDYLTSIVIHQSITQIGYQAFGQCKFLTSIAYMGTVAQWKAIIFAIYWNYNTGNYIIHCTDGDIAKDGTITYY